MRRWAAHETGWTIEALFLGASSFAPIPTGTDITRCTTALVLLSKCMLYAPARVHIGHRGGMEVAVAVADAELGLPQW